MPAMPAMPDIQTLYHSDFKTKLYLARQIHQEHGTALLAIPLIRRGMEALDHQAENLQEQMAALNLAPLCIKCSRKKGGGCCSLFMADENDAILLLINLLAGLPLSIQKDDDFECYLLGPQGCILRFKPFFCLNYNCQAIQTHTDEKVLAAYLAASGQLLHSQWQVERLILDYFS